MSAHPVVVNGLVVVLSLLLLACNVEGKHAGECRQQCSSIASCAPEQICTNGWCAYPDRGPCFGPASVLDASATDDASGSGDGMADAGPVNPVDATPAVDAPPALDATPIDAPPSTPDASECPADCDGTCESGVCVIACRGEADCEGGARCPSSGPCRIECTGEKSCKGEVRCGSGPCEVLCAGEKSCSEAVQCGSGSCRVSCSGEKSCAKVVECAGACACDVTCSGDRACGMASVCPLPICAAGDGCTSSPIGCSRCS